MTKLSPPVDVAERLATPIMLLDKRLHVGWMNEAMGTLLEVGVRGLLGQAVGNLFDPADALNGAIERLQSGEPLVQCRHVRLVTLRQNECVVDMQVQALPEACWLLELHDLAASSDASTPLSATLRGMAHEVRNPLAGLRGAAQLLGKRHADPDVQQLTHMMIREVDRLDTLTHRLLATGTQARLDMINLHQLLARVIELAQGQAPALSIHEDYDPSLPDVSGDADRLQQLLLNLFRNALQAGANRLCLRTRFAHRVRLPSGSTCSAVRVDVVDDGSGVPPHLHETLFQPLVSGHPDGTGLGLSLARETAREHGGDLHHAQTDEGTVFTLHLPLQHVRSGEDP